MRMQGWVSCTLILVIALMECPLSAKPLTLRVSDAVYANNLEYTGAVDRFREGETFFGNLLTSELDLAMLPGHAFRAGILVRMPYGSEKILDPIAPLFSLQSSFFEEQLKIIAGSIENNHLAHEAILDNALFYTRPVELGLQAKAYFNWLKGEIWIDWQRMESSEHNEKFDAGLTLQAMWKVLFAAFETHYSHLGGQLFNNGDPVIDDSVLALGGGIMLNVPLIQKLEFSAHQLFSRRLVRVREEKKEGKGAELKLKISPYGVDLFSSFWRGEGYFHEDGDPLYRAKDYLQFGLHKVFSLSSDFRIALDLRLRIVERTPVHSESVLFSWQGDFGVLDL